MVVIEGAPTLLPALALAVIWTFAQPAYLSQQVAAELPTEVAQGDPIKRGFAVREIVRLSRYVDILTEEEKAGIRSGELNMTNVFLGYRIAVSSGLEPYMLDAAEKYAARSQTGYFFRLIGALLVSGVGMFYGYSQLSPGFRARNTVEFWTRLGLIICSLAAILTTVAIVLSMTFESLRFFREIPILDFLFGTVWDPRFTSVGRIEQTGTADGQFGLIPLLWGTMYISLIALCVAGPIGLYSAIYLSEYADGQLRAFAKPMLEILAGIPTIVYGFFAIVTLGPILYSIGDMLGLPIQSNSVLTAGLVMGMMIVPFVSSLSDDIINAVPQTLRDGSYALGATQSETIKKVVLPAALPGVVGAFLLAASRAIGETMIVVMAAGVAANISLWPGEPMTTITVKIVSQLTGDTEFTSPQTLVAFALGATLFVITLFLNIIALQIVRHYREQYE